jgi:hypothetical protein
MCIEHMAKITANNSHRYDDIADTCFDAVDIGLIRGVAISHVRRREGYEEIARSFTVSDEQNKLLRLQRRGEPV